MAHSLFTSCLHAYHITSVGTAILLAADGGLQNINHSVSPAAPGSSLQTVSPPKFFSVTVGSGPTGRCTPTTRTAFPLVPAHTHLAFRPSPLTFGISCRLHVTFIPSPVNTAVCVQISPFNCQPVCWLPSLPAHEKRRCERDLPRVRFHTHPFPACRGAAAKHLPPLPRRPTSQNARTAFLLLKLCALTTASFLPLLAHYLLPPPPNITLRFLAPLARAGDATPLHTHTAHHSFPLPPSLSALPRIFLRRLHCYEDSAELAHRACPSAPSAPLLPAATPPGCAHLQAFHATLRHTSCWAWRQGFACPHFRGRRARAKGRGGQH